MNVSHEFLGKCGKCGRHGGLVGRHGWLAGWHGGLVGRYGWLVGWLVGWQECWICNSLNVCINCFIYSIFPTLKNPMFVTIFFECRGSRGLTLVTIRRWRKTIFIQRIIQKWDNIMVPRKKCLKLQALNL